MSASEKEAVALGSILASGGMTIGKFAVGFATGSLGLISEGAHSLLDLGATVMTYFAVRISDTPADAEHPYGHGKIESVTALAETGLLFLTSLGIVYEAVHRLLANEVEVSVTWWSIAVVLVSIAIDAYRARELSRVAKATHSQALEADALHFSSDILSSAVVLVGLGLVWLGYPRGDAIAAIGVSVFVCLAGYNLGRRTIDALIDAAPTGTAAEISEIAAKVPGIVRVQRTRVRTGGSVLFVDLDVAVSRTLALNQAAEIKRQVATAVQTAVPRAELNITAHPLALDEETIAERVAVCADARGLAVHHITVQRVQGRLSVSFDLEVDGNLVITAAHEIAEGLEAAIAAELGPDVEVETHIEPLESDSLDGTDVNADVLAEMAAAISAGADRDPRIRDVHSVRVRQNAGGLIVNFHCLMLPSLNVTQAHAAVDELERWVRQQWPQVYRVVSHAEPA